MSLLHLQQLTRSQQMDELLDVLIESGGKQNVRLIYWLLEIKVTLHITP